MTNTSTWRTAHTCELGLPTAYVAGLGIASGVASSRVRTVAIGGTVMPITTGDVSLQADRVVVAGAVKDAAVDTSAFPGPLAWSPPI
jgi:hypothetical protein